MNLKTMESILAKGFPKSTSFSTLEVIELLRTRERIPPKELSDSAIYRYVRDLLSARKLLISGSKSHKNRSPTTYYQITDLLNKNPVANSWFGNPIGIYLQDFFTHFGTDKLTKPKREN